MCLHCKKQQQQQQKKASEFSLDYLTFFFFYIRSAVTDGLHPKVTTTLSTESNWYF